MSVDSADIAGMPRPASRGGLRRSLQLEEALDSALRSGASVVLDGPGVNDLLVTASGEARRLPAYLAGWAADNGLATMVYSLARGVRPLTPPGSMRTLPAPPELPEGTAPTIVLEHLLRFIGEQSVPALLVVDYAEGLVPNDAGSSMPLDVARLIEQLAGLAADARWVEAGHRLALVARTGHVDIRLTSYPGILTATVGLPDEVERWIFLSRIVRSTRPLVLHTDLDLDRAARLAGGLLIDDLNRLRANASPDNPVTSDHIVAAKVAVLRRLAGPTIEILTERLTLERDVAGLPQLRLLLREAKATGNTSLRVILAGPAGNGKTRAFTALAAELGVPAVRLAQIRAPLVGQAEDNMDRALNAITAMAPCALLIDECDEAGLGRRGERGAESSEVTANLRAKLFGWLGDTGSRIGITVVGTTNRPDRLDDASISRFWVLPVLPPTTEEAGEIMRIQAEREGRLLDAATASAELARQGAEVSGRHAVGLVERAAVSAAYSGRQDIAATDLRQAVGDLMSQLSPVDEYHALLALSFTSWKSHLPWNAARSLGLTVRLPAAVRRLLDPATGEIDRHRLRQRLDELRATPGVAD